MMQSLTPKERVYLQEALQLENLCMTKCNVYADQCQDDGLKAVLFEMSKIKRRNADRIKQLLSQSMLPNNDQ
jgi:hypothetical protein